MIPVVMIVIVAVVPIIPLVGPTVVMMFFPYFTSRKGEQGGQTKQISEAFHNQTLSSKFPREDAAGPWGERPARPSMYRARRTGRV